LIDLHCHILPGLDDGAPDLAASLAMARVALADGISQVVATPHVFDGVYETTRADAQAALARLRSALAEASLPLTVHLGAECRLDPRLLDSGCAWRSLALAGGRYVLVELPHATVPPGVEGAFFRLRARGIVPLLAHPERNAELRRGQLDRIASWVAGGVRLQVTAGSLTGGFGRRTRAFARKLVVRGLCHVVASDAHASTGRLPQLSAARAEVVALVGEAAATAVVSTYPRRILGIG